jgi:hypothetical protein
MADPKTTTATKAGTKTTTKTAQSHVVPTKIESPTPTGGDVPVRTAESTTATVVASSTSSKSQLETRDGVEYAPRRNVTLNFATVANAFHNALASRSVRYVQYALHERGFEPGNDRGLVDFDTRKAYAEFQGSVGERKTGVPTDYSLNVLGFDVS